MFVYFKKSFVYVFGLVKVDRVNNDHYALKKVT